MSVVAPTVVRRCKCEEGLLAVSKVSRGSRKGTGIFVCGKPRDEGCDYFSWEDAPEVMPECHCGNVASLRAKFGTDDQLFFNCAKRECSFYISLEGRTVAEWEAAGRPQGTGRVNGGGAVLNSDDEYDDSPLPIAGYDSGAPVTEEDYRALMDVCIDHAGRLTIDEVRRNLTSNQIGTTKTTTTTTKPHQPAEEMPLPQKRKAEEISSSADDGSQEEIVVRPPRTAEEALRDRREKSAWKRVLKAMQEAVDAAEEIPLRLADVLKVSVENFVESIYDWVDDGDDDSFIDNDDDECGNALADDEDEDNSFEPEEEDDGATEDYESIEEASEDEAEFTDKEDDDEDDEDADYAEYDDEK